MPSPRLRLCSAALRGPHCWRRCAAFSTPSAHAVQTPAGNRVPKRAQAGTTAVLSWTGAMYDTLVRTGTARSLLI